VEERISFKLGQSELSSPRTFNFPDKSYIWDKLDEIFSQSLDFKNRIDSKFADKPFSCYNFEQNEFDINYDLDCVIEEAVEAKQLLNRKKWKDERHEVDKQKLLEELIDIDKFVIQAILRLGFNACDVYEMHKKKYLKNIKRQEEGY
jgi:hypothetical protein